MTTRQFVTKSGDTWEWEETPETIAAVKQLHETVQSNAVKRLHNDIRTAEQGASDYGIGK